MDLNDLHIAKIFDSFRPDIVIHHAGHVDVKDSMDRPLADAAANIMGTINLLEQCKNCNVRKIIYASSAAVYGTPVYLGIDELHPVHPISNYGVSKYTSEMYIRTFAHNYGLVYTILRYSNVYGYKENMDKDNSVVSAFIYQIFNEEQFRVNGDGMQTRDFIYVEDVAKANIAALDRGVNETINISSNTPTTVLQVKDIIQSMAGSKVNTLFAASRQGDIDHSFLDNALARRLLDWRPTYTLEDGLTEVIQQYKKNHNINFVV